MKKLFALISCMALSVSILAGCGSGTAKDTKTPDSAGSKTTVTSGTSSTKAASNASADPADYKVVMIVKQSDSWFDDMATGVEQLKKDTGLNVSVQVPETGDAASQISIMENLIAQGVNAICVVPNDPEALIPTIEKARKAGIVVVTHEAPGIAGNVDLDVEAFINERVNM